MQRMNQGKAKSKRGQKQNYIDRSICLFGWVRVRLGGPGPGRVRQNGSRAEWQAELAFAILNLGCCL